MTTVADRHDPPFSETHVAKIVEDMGGPGAILNDLEEFRHLVDRLWSERAELMDIYPDRWVAMGVNGVVAAGDSMRAVLDKVEGLGMRRRDVVVEFLDTDPPPLIL